MPKWGFCCFPVGVTAAAAETDDDDDKIDVKSKVVTKKPSIVFLCNLANGTSSGKGIGVIIKKDVVLTSHSTVPNVSSAKYGEVTIVYPVLRGCCSSSTTLKHKLLTDKFFITNSLLDITVIACEDVTCVDPLRSTTSNSLVGCSDKVYILGQQYGNNSNVIEIGEGYVTVANDPIVKFVTNGAAWIAGSAGFDRRGELAFMVCQPKKCITRSASIVADERGRGRGRGRGFVANNIVNQTSVSVGEIVSWMENHLTGDGDNIRSSNYGDAFAATVDEDVRDEKLLLNAAAAVVDDDEYTSSAVCDGDVEDDAADYVYTAAAADGGDNYECDLDAAITVDDDNHGCCEGEGEVEGEVEGEGEGEGEDEGEEGLYGDDIPKLNPRRSGISYPVTPSERSRSASRTSRSPHRSSSSRPNSPITTALVDFHHHHITDDSQRQVSLTTTSSSDESIVSKSKKCHSVAATKKRIFISNDGDGNGDGDGDINLYLRGVGYMKHTQLSKTKSHNKRDDTNCLSTPWHF